ncbi:hypothetical protein BGW36DRAFT_210491 [Talaromyces proteolyticus]|uniref:DUF7492 domain-containing protein n=1 Tax=Talaromyces proteolyticus TaxID=1131652 RepID=A0AAD4PVQ6_9EURO|nr:uncharacterized protein BGW36DRAFT_210491 [Talaromyces proteolyticus]KAH8693772.1 hypothetical protein BGW36DRAFT_210491 [Talaromyces proteolyticus]
MLDIMMHDATTMFLTAAMFFASLIDAHSWVEQLTVVSPNGTFVGPKGYPRGNVLRTAAGWNDKMMQWQLPTHQGNQLLNNMTMCRPSQQSANYTEDSPALQAAAGAVVALRYQENGHVTQPWIKSGKPEHSGTVYVYGTEQPRPDDTLLSIHNVWTFDGSGGDKRGRLLSSQHFDDGECYQINNASYISVDRQNEFPRTPGAGSVEGADLWCQTDITLPSSLKSNSQYTLYWVWDWPTLTTSNTTYLPELYTTCMDIDITDVAGSADKQVNVGFSQVTNYGDAAIQTVFEKLTSGGTVTVQSQPANTNTLSGVASAQAGVTSAANAPTQGGQTTPSLQVNSNCGAAMTVTVRVPTTVTAATITVTSTTPLPAITVTQTVTVTTIPSTPGVQPTRRFSRKALEKL